MTIFRVTAKKAILAGGASLLLPLLQACFTGVEGTSRINLSKKDIIATAPTEEDRLLAGVRPAPLKDWERGKAFMVSDEKFRLVAEGTADLKVRDIIRFDRSETRTAPGGGEATALVFTTGDGQLEYLLSKPLGEALETATAADIPMLIEMGTVEDVGRILRGRKVWVKTALWLDNESAYMKGKKFIPVEITAVEPGDAFFPLKVEFRTVDGQIGILLMNLGNSGNESRSFGKLFSLTDPREQYRQITPENWVAIQEERLRPGMTKEECRLSKGNPADVDTGHTYSNAMEIWYYPDGSYLQFVDGLLTGYK